VNGIAPDAVELTPALDAVDWSRVERELEDTGHSVLAELLPRCACEALAALYTSDRAFRSQVVMARHGYGRGEYKYFDYPLPPLVAALRERLYARLAPIANRWSEALRSAAVYPAALSDYLALCRGAGQGRATPLVLRYGAGDYNRLHQDVYGELWFPLQVAVLLSSPQRDFSGGEFVLTEQRARTQARASVVPLRQGDAVAFAVRHRPERGARWFRRVTMKHGVSTVRAGERFTLGVIFHDAT